MLAPSLREACCKWSPGRRVDVTRSIAAGRARQHHSLHRKRIVRSAGMYVPSDSFGGQSPERKASELLRTLFTFCAVKIVLAQMEGSGRGSLGSYNAQGYDDLSSFLADEPMRNGDAWLEALLKKNEMLALRVMEVRKAYCAEDFEWEICRAVAAKEMEAANVRLLRSRAEEAFLRASADRSSSNRVDD